MNEGNASPDGTRISRVLNMFGFNRKWLLDLIGSSAGAVTACGARRTRPDISGAADVSSGKARPGYGPKKAARKPA